MLRLLMLGGLVKVFFRWFLRHHYMIEGSCFSIGPYLRLPHPRGIILAAESIGSNCLIGQFVTLGGNNCKFRILDAKIIELSQICNNVQILAGSVVAGPIIVENEVVIGANSTVTFNVSSNSLIYNRPSLSTNKINVPGYLGAFYRHNN